jgi:antagonist of KipI
LINKGDVVYGNPRTLRRNRGLNYCDIPTYKQEVVVRYIPGPHLEYFEKDSTRLFEGQSFTYIQGDRMGSRLKATKPIPFQKPTQLPSDPIPFGAIQVPPDGNPIVLMADRQTTGGYPRIGTVISIDIPKLAQLQLGGKVQFQPVTIEEAQSLNILQQKTFNIWNKTTRFN